MKFKKRERDGVVIIDVSGQLMGGPEADAFHALVKEVLEGGSKQLLVNLAKVTWMNSTGLGILLRAYASVCNADGQLKLMKLTDRVRSLIVITKLYTIFEIFEEEDEALASFQAAKS